MVDSSKKLDRTGLKELSPGVLNHTVRVVAIKKLNISILRSLFFANKEKI
tara:strand:- start:811 stop:960 length:150 start_codon:yes stop_codon:yes gene_type:complete